MNSEFFFRLPSWEKIATNISELIMDVKSSTTHVIGEVEAANILGISVGEFRKLRKKVTLSIFQISRKYFFFFDEILKLKTQ